VNTDFSMTTIMKKQKRPKTEISQTRGRRLTFYRNQNWCCLKEGSKYITIKRILTFLFVNGKKKYIRNVTLFLF
jgi:hypothetical protein